MCRPGWRLAAQELQWAWPLLKSGEEDSLETICRILRQLERCWSDAVRYAGSPASEDEL